ncbi:uncharacterized protein LOC142140326 [Mixophyes fleayi]|uniref:uncharacterized protein LOC142140326 n=1 Tax=Mixophyes fleayi TaxID=3061075 RepID=UPI003F4D82B7
MSSTPLSQTMILLMFPSPQEIVEPRQLTFNIDLQGQAGVPFGVQQFVCHYTLKYFSNAPRLLMCFLPLPRLSTLIANWARLEQRQRHQPVVEEDEQQPQPEQPQPPAQQPEQPLPTAQQQPLPPVQQQAEGDGDANDEGEADLETEVEGQGKADDESPDKSEAEPQSSISASGDAESELEAAAEPEPEAQEDNGQLVLPQVDEALGETHVEQSGMCPTHLQNNLVLK